jgi:hypothetical protein
MNRTLAWLAAMICAGGFVSSASAFEWRPFAGLRHGNCDTCTTDQGAPPAAQVVTDQKNLPPGTVVNGGVGCRTGLGGSLAGIPQKVLSAKEAVCQWISNVPQKTPPPPKPLPINPYVRSPRDYFMVDDP